MSIIAFLCDRGEKRKKENDHQKFLKRVKLIEKLAKQSTVLVSKASFKIKTNCNLAKFRNPATIWILFLFSIANTASGLFRFGFGLVKGSSASVQISQKALN